jgi:hypothetical protein
MSTILWVALVAVAIVAGGYLLVMRMLLRKSRELDRQIDPSKIKPWRDDED